MSKFTKPPWKIDTDRMDDRYMILDDSEEGYFIACIYPAWENNEANARLIAAAPELLEALQRFVAFADGINRARTDKFESSMVRDAKAAIAKATGDSSNAVQGSDTTKMPKEQKPD